MGVKIIDTLSSVRNWFKKLEKKKSKFCGLKKGHPISMGSACAPNDDDDDDELFLWYVWPTKGV